MLWTVFVLPVLISMVHGEEKNATNATNTTDDDDDDVDALFQLLDYREKERYNRTELTDSDIDALVKTKITIDSGDLYGNVFEFVGGEIYQAWTDIPYAYPPVGDRRFKYADPDIKWSTPRNVSAKLPEQCLQYNFIPNIPNRYVGSEEACLMLTVYRYLGSYFEHKWLTEKDPGAAKLFHVVVLLHPGTFMYDFPFDGRRFAANLCCENIIVVVVNYRLGHLGFLALGNNPKAPPANLGLFDQVTAMKWVQRNIPHFLGDPNKITLVGVAAGAAAVQLHLLSRKSFHFHQAMSFGGSALVPWALGSNVAAKSYHYVFNNLKCRRILMSEIRDCLANLTFFDDIKNVLHPYNQHAISYAYQNMPMSPFGPVVDENFLEEDPLIMLRAGAVRTIPYVLSFTDAAGLLPAAQLWDKPILEDRVNTYWNLEMGAYALDYNHTMYDKLKPKFSERTREFYYPILPGHQKSLFDDFNAFVKMLTDRLYTTGIVEAARLQGFANTSQPTWVYRFSYQGEFSFSDVLFGSRQLWGPPVGDDFMTYIANQYPLRHRKDINMGILMKHLFISFIFEGVPSVPRELFDKLHLKRKNDQIALKDTRTYFHTNQGYIRANRKASYITTYNHILRKNYSSRTVHSNNVGRGKYWRRAPILHPGVFTEDRSYYKEYFQQYAWDKFPDIDSVLKLIDGKINISDSKLVDYNPLEDDDYIAF